MSLGARGASDGGWGCPACYGGTMPSLLACALPLCWLDPNPRPALKFITTPSPTPPTTAELVGLITARFPNVRSKALVTTWVLGAGCRVGWRTGVWVWCRVLGRLLDCVAAGLLPPGEVPAAMPCAAQPTPAPVPPTACTVPLLTQVRAGSGGVVLCRGHGPGDAQHPQAQRAEPRRGAARRANEHPALGEG